MPLLILVIFLAITSVSGQYPEQKDIMPTASYCADSKIVYDISAIESIYLFPETVLANVDSFWNSNKTMSLTKQWHSANKIPVPYAKWEKWVAKISKLSPEKARNQIAFVNAEKMFRNEAKFNEEAIPHICSFLPESTPVIKSIIHLAANINPYAFAMGDDIGIDVIAPNYHNNPDNMLNILVHEVYHAGYAYTENKRTESKLGNPMIDFVMDYLMTEGVADYVSYTAQSIFPNKKFKDYVMLESGRAVKKQIENVNSVFSGAEDLPADDLRKLSWKIGVVDRAYYVAGAFMAKTIDEKLGRDSLISCICTGPRKFIHTYNSLVNDEMKIIEFGELEKVADVK